MLVTGQAVMDILSYDVGGVQIFVGWYASGPSHDDIYLDGGVLCLGQHHQRHPRYLIHDNVIHYPRVQIRTLSQLNNMIQPRYSKSVQSDSKFRKINSSHLHLWLLSLEFRSLYVITRCNFSSVFFWFEWFEFFWPPWVSCGQIDKYIWDWLADWSFLPLSINQDG